MNEHGPGTEYFAQSARQLPATLREFLFAQETYDRVANTPGAGEEDISTAKAEADRWRQDVIDAGLQPFGAAPTSAEQEIIRTVFPFLLDRERPPEREVSEIVTRYRSSLRDAAGQLLSRDARQREAAYARLSEPNEEVETALLACINQQVIDMWKQAGSVDAFFRTIQDVECFDPEQLFDNPYINSLVERIGRTRAKLKQWSLGIPHVSPYDTYVQEFAPDVLDLPKPDPRETGARMLGPFLWMLGLEDMRPDIVVAIGEHEQSLLEHIGPARQPRSIIQLQEGRSVAVQERTIAHETGHGAQRQVSDREPDVTGRHTIKYQGLAELPPDLSEWPAKLLEAIFCSREGARAFRFSLAGRKKESAWYDSPGFSRMASNLKFLEFSYRLYRRAEDCLLAGTALTADAIGELYAEVQQKHQQVVYPPGAGGKPIDRTWRYALGQHIPFRPFTMRAYVLSSALANSTLYEFRRLGLTFGRPGFSQAFSTFFRRTFAPGPYLQLGDVERQLNICLADAIPRQLGLELADRLRAARRALRQHAFHRLFRRLIPS